MPEPFRGTVNVDIRDSQPGLGAVRAAQGPAGSAECRVHALRMLATSSSVVRGAKSVWFRREVVHSHGPVCRSALAGKCR